MTFQKGKAAGFIDYAINSKRYKARCNKEKEMEEKVKLLELATQRQRFGYRRLHPLMKEAGFTMNHKKVYRLYKEAKLSLHVKKGKKKSVILERVPLVVSALHTCWSMDFMHDRLTDGRAFRCFGVIDNYSHLSIALKVASSFPALRVIAVLEVAIKEYGKPQVHITERMNVSYAKA